MNRGTLVLLPGIARGMDQGADIEVLARKVEDSSADGVLPVYRYEDCTVLGGPADLPVGDYIVYFAGFNIAAARRNGIWLSSGSAIPDSARDSDEAPSGTANAGTAIDAITSGPLTREADKDPIAPSLDPIAPSLKISPSDGDPPPFLV